jgi:hypothetical protein
MRKKMLYPSIALIALGVGMLITACNKGGDHNPVGSDPVALTPSTPASGGAAAAPAAPANGTGISVTLVSTTFDKNSMCTDLSKPEFANLTELVEVDTVKNNTTREVYTKPALFHSDTAGCGATDANPSGVIGLMDAPNIPAGGTATWTHRFAIPDRKCGRWQFDNDAMNGEIRRSTLQGGVGGVVINSGVDCPSCAAFDVQLSVTGSGLTRNVSVSFKGQKANKKAHVDFGDNTSADLTNGQSVSHTWPYGEFVVSVTLDAQDIQCSTSQKVINTREDTCENHTPPPITGDISSDIQTAQVVFDKGDVGPAGGSFNPTLPQTVARPAEGQPAGSFSTTYSKVYYEPLQCRVSKTFTKPVPPQDHRKTCDDYEKPVFSGDLGISLSTTQATITSGTVSPSGGSFNPTLPATVNRPNAGQPDATFSTTYSKTYGPDGQCTATHVYTKSVPAQADTCDNYTPTPPTFGGALALTNETATTETVTSGTVSPSGGSWSTSLPATVNRPAAGSTATFSDNYTVIVSYGPSALHCTKSYSNVYSISIPAQVPPGACYYRVSCGVSFAGFGGVEQSTQTSCTDQNQQWICEHTNGGNPLAHGIWRNFGDANLLNHCQFTVPGVSLINFQLNPGQSDRACLNKND